MAGGGDPGAAQSAGGLAVPRPSEIHAASYTTVDLVRTGAQHLIPAEFPSQLIEDSGDICKFTPDWTKESPASTGLAFAAYQFGVEGFDLDGQIFMSWVRSGERHDLWVGLADTENDCWCWVDTHTKGMVFADVSGHMDPGDNSLTVLVVCTGQDIWELEWIQVGEPATVDGYVYDSDGNTPLGQVEVSISGGVGILSNHTARTGSAGRFRMPRVNPGEYQATARLIGYEFAPAAHSFSVQAQDVTIDDFIGTSTCTAEARGMVSEGASPFGLPGVEMWFEQEGVTGGCFAVLTDVDGNWAADLPDGNFTVTPVKDNWTFTPESRDFTVSGTDVEVDVFQADPAASYTIDGYIFEADGTTPLSGIGVNVTSGAMEMFYHAVTGIDGHWEVGGLFDDTYTAEPQFYGWGFTPSSQDAVVNGADVTLDPFIGEELAEVTVDGYIYFADGVTPVPGCKVQVTCDFGWYNLTTDSSGHYQLSGIFGGYFCVTPVDLLYTFEPESRETTTYSDWTADPFLATPVPTYTVDGYVLKDDGTTPVEGASVTLWAYMPAGTVYTAYTDAAGHWELANIAPHTYWVSALKQGYTFVPEVTSITVEDGDETVETFYGTCPEAYLLDGYIYELDGSTPVPGVPVDIRGSLYHFQATTDATGYWAAEAVFDDTYTVLPMLAPWAFTPRYRQVTVAGADLRVDSFLGEELPGWTVDGYIFEAASTIPVPGVNVLFSDGDLSYRVASDAAGYYSLPLPNGAWDVTPLSDGCWDFDPFIQQITVSSAPQSLAIFYASPGG